MKLQTLKQRRQKRLRLGLRLAFGAVVVVLIAILSVNGYLWHLHLSKLFDPKSDEPVYIAYAHEAFPSALTASERGALVHYNKFGEAIKVVPFAGLGGTELLPYEGNYIAVAQNGINIISPDLEIVETVLEDDQVLRARTPTISMAGDYRVVGYLTDDEYGMPDLTRLMWFGPDGQRRLYEHRQLIGSSVCPDGTLFVIRLRGDFDWAVAEDYLADYEFVVVSPTGESKVYRVGGQIKDYRIDIDYFDCDTHQISGGSRLGPKLEDLLAQSQLSEFEWFPGEAIKPDSAVPPDEEHWQYWFEPRGDEVRLVKAMQMQTSNLGGGPLNTYGNSGKWETFISPESKLRFQDLTNRNMYELGEVSCGDDQWSESKPEFVSGTVTSSQIAYECLHDVPYQGDPDPTEGYHMSYMIGQWKWDENGIPMMPEFEQVHLQNIVDGLTPGLTDGSLRFPKLLSVHWFTTLDQPTSE